MSRTSKALLRAECQDCPTTHNTDWGYEERVSIESPDETRVKAWAYNHVYAKDSPTKGHRLTFSRVVRFSVDVEQMNSELLAKLFGLGVVS